MLKCLFINEYYNSELSLKGNMTIGRDFENAR